MIEYAEFVTLSLIQFEEIIFLLSSDLVCYKQFKDHLYFISNYEFDIEVWGETIQEAEEAFDFAFYSLYLAYCLEDVDKLSDGVKILKIKLKNKVKKIIWI